MKTLISTIASMFLVFSAYSQSTILYSIVPYGTNSWIPPLSTNIVVIGGRTNSWNTTPTYGRSTNLIQDVKNFDEIGFTEQIQPTVGMSNAPVGVQVFLSYDDGNIWGNAPFVSYTNIFTAAQCAAGTPWVTNCVLNVPGASKIAFVIINNSGGVATNYVLEIKPKAPRYDVILSPY